MVPNTYAPSFSFDAGLTIEYSQILYQFSYMTYLFTSDLYVGYFQDQRHEIALAITRNLRVFTKKDVHPEETESLSDAVVDVIRSSSSEKIIAHHNNVVDAESSALQLFVCKVRSTFKTMRAFVPF